MVKLLTSLLKVEDTWNGGITVMLLFLTHSQEVN